MLTMFELLSLEGFASINAYLLDIGKQQGFVVSIVRMSGTSLTPDGRLTGDAWEFECAAFTLLLAFLHASYSLLNHHFSSKPQFCKIM